MANELYSNKELNKILNDLHIAVQELNYRLKTLQEEEKENREDIEELKNKINALEKQIMEIQVRVNQTNLVLKAFVGLFGAVGTIYGVIMLFVK